MKNLKGRTIRGGVAKTGAQAINILLRIGSLMVLARLLDPEDFGLIGMVTAVTGVFSLFKDAGLSMATIQRAAISNEQVSTLFWINMLVGAILGFLSTALAPLLVLFYHEPRLLWVTVALALGFVLNAAGVQHAALLQREMRFVALSVIEVASQLVGVAVGIGMAVGGSGYWALVAMALVMPATTTVGAWLATAWVPGAPRRGIGIGSMMRFGGIVTLNGLVVYVAYNTEQVLLGRFWGADALGIYGRGYQLVSIPTESLSAAVGGVAFSALSRLQGEPGRLKQYFLKGYSIIVSMTLPITVACALFSDDLILFLLGPKWMDAAVIFRFLAPTILVFSLVNPLSWLLYSIGLAERSLKIAFLIAPTVIAAYIIGLPFGPNGVALGYSAAMILLSLPIAAWAIHGTIIGPRDLLQAVRKPLISTVAAAAFALAVHQGFGPSLPLVPRLALGCGILFGTYVWMLLYVMGQKAFYLDLLRELT